MFGLALDRGLFVFVHPALKLNQTQQFDGYDTARSVGREFSLVMATIVLAIDAPLAAACWRWPATR